MSLRALTTVLMLVLVASAAAGGAADRRTDHVVLISVDGLRPEFYLEERWPAPMLQQMRREGAHARAVKSVFPSVTYPAHTTIITGRMPIDHGISYNSPFEPQGQTGRWYWEEDAHPGADPLGCRPRRRAQNRQYLLARQRWCARRLECARSLATRLGGG